MECVWIVAAGTWGIDELDVAQYAFSTREAAHKIYEQGCLRVPGLRWSLTGISLDKPDDALADIESFTKDFPDELP